jgi:glucose-6-phosphate 1-dehydrogenase
MPPIRLQASGQPTALIVFGATGDLTQRKIYPALYQLAARGLLPERFFLFGLAREDLTAEQYEATVREDVTRALGAAVSEAVLDRLLSGARYLSSDLSERAGYERLEALIQDEEKRLGQAVQRLFYLALPPSLFAQVVRSVESCRMGKALCSVNRVLSRVIVEKPFGYDYASAAELETTLGEAFHERQIYRMDHYLGKEAVQNILAFRGANALFDHVWNREHVAAIHLSALEDIGLERRGPYYDRAGALRDMVQNHLLELLAFMTMRPVTDAGKPEVEMAARAELMEALRPLGGRVELVTGQYAGYAGEPGVAAGSRTETYAALALEVDNDDWRGVPIMVRTGKRLASKETTVTVTFKAAGGGAPNRLTVEIAPNQALTLCVNLVKPGFTRETDVVGMHYCRGEHYADPAVGDYERLLLAAVDGDRSMFVSSREVLAGWRAVDPFVRAAASANPTLYEEAAGDGPPAGDELAVRLGFPWPVRPETCPVNKG